MVEFCGDSPHAIRPRPQPLQGLSLRGDRPCKVRDRASCGACPQPWSQGSLIWSIPFGWHPFTADGTAPVMGTLPTKEFATDVTHTIVINSTGFVILMKLGHWVSRDIYNEIALDGVVVREGEQ